MENQSQWLMRIEGGLSAHFFQPDGTSRPGTDWTVGLRKDGQTCRVTVRAYLGEDMTARARADTEYQGRTVLGYISDLLAQGWTPGRGDELVVTIQNPTGENSVQAARPWWKLW